MAKTEEMCACNRFVPVTEAAALAAAEWIGRGDGLAADQAARDAMAAALVGLSFDTRVVAGRMAFGLADQADTAPTPGSEADVATAEAVADALRGHLGPLGPGGGSTGGPRSSGAGPRGRPGHAGCRSSG